MNVLTFFGIPFEHDFPDNQGFVWSVLKSFIALLLLIVWFFSTSQHWKYLLFLLISVFLNSLLEHFFFFLLFEAEIRFHCRATTLILFCLLLFVFDLFIFANYRKNRVEASLQLIFDRDFKSSYRNYQKSIELFMKDKMNMLSSAHLNRMYHIGNSLKKWLDKHNRYSMGIIANKKIILNIIIGIVLLLTPFIVVSPLFNS